mgnify:CR=1 FL=1
MYHKMLIYLGNMKSIKATINGLIVMWQIWTGYRLNLFIIQFDFTHWKYPMDIGFISAKDIMTLRL